MKMSEIVKLIVDNGITVVCLGYFMFLNYKFNEKLTQTLTKVSETLYEIEDKMKKGDK